MQKENKNYYSSSFFVGQMQESLQSAREMVPYIIDLVKPASVVDVGCGIGTWASVFIESGISDVQGIDGAYVQKSQLLIPENRFMSQDLTKSLDIKKTYDLAISLEVAEHLLPAEGPQFIKTLTLLAPVVVFSAAIPKQGGTNHTNEQWQSYWASEFEKNGYEAYDVIRPHFWNNQKVYPCYKQNMILYISSSYKIQHPELSVLIPIKNKAFLDIAHPIAFESKNDPDLITIRDIIRHMLLTPQAVMKKIKKIFKR